MKKLFTLLFALVATTALWAADFKVDGIYYNLLTDKTNEVEVTRGSPNSDYGDEYSGSVTIPATVTYKGTTYSVTSIGIAAFWDCESLTSITIPNSVTSIANAAFSNTGIYNDDSNWENGVLYISNCLIEVKPDQATYTIKDGTRVIAGGAFYDCSYLTSITIPNSVTSIGEGAFALCDGLTSPVYNAHCFAYMPTSYYGGAYTIPDGIKQNNEHYRREKSNQSNQRTPPLRYLLRC